MVNPSASRILRNIFAISLIIAGGRSVLVIEHDMQFVEDIADHVTVMHQGKVLSEGSINKVKNDPRVIDVYLGH